MDRLQYIYRKAFIKKKLHTFTRIDWYGILHGPRIMVNPILCIWRIKEITYHPKLSTLKHQAFIIYHKLTEHYYWSDQGSTLPRPWPLVSYKLASWLCLFCLGSVMFETLARTTGLIHFCSSGSHTHRWSHDEGREQEKNWKCTSASSSLCICPVSTVLGAKASHVAEPNVGRNNTDTGQKI